jgi:CheY-like chemotaxis protein
MDATAARILVVEDDPILRSLVVKVARRSGYDSVSAETGEEALCILRSPDQRVDGLLTDIRLPGVDGWAVGTEFTLAHPLRPVIYMSGLEPDSSSKRTANSIFLRKPVGVRLLADTLKICIGGTTPILEPHLLSGTAMRHASLSASAGLLLAGCASVTSLPTVHSTGSMPATDSVVPWQVAPAIELTSKPGKEAPSLKFVEGWGPVLATPRVLATLPQPLRSEPGPNRTVRPCKRQIELGAAHYGKVRVQAASLGPERLDRHGLFEGLVEVRVVYENRSFYEVRQATLKCYARQDGSIVDAKVVFPTEPGEG